MNQTTPYVIAQYKLGRSSIDIAKELAISKQAVLSRLCYHNIPRRTLSQSVRRYVINENFFNQINREDKAYWLGFLLGDGGIANTGRFGKARQLRVALQTGDTRHLEKLKGSMQSNHPIKIREIKLKNKIHKASWLVITSKKLVQPLLDYGWVNFKKRGDTAILNIAKKLQPHMIRGLIDADGSLGIYNNQPRFHYVDLHLNVVKWVQSWMIENIKIIKTKIRKPSKAHSFAKSCSDAVKICKHLYEHATISLDRKQKIAEEIMA